MQMRTLMMMKISKFKKDSLRAVFLFLAFTSQDALTDNIAYLCSGKRV